MAGSLERLSRAYNAVGWGGAVEWPGDQGRRRLYGLDLFDARSRRSAGKPCRDALGRQSRVPECPVFPPQPQAAWPTVAAWAPAWLELPLPHLIPRDFWYYPEQEARGIPEIWLCPSWGPGARPGQSDPEAVCMLFCVVERRPGLPCLHYVGCPRAFSKHHHRFGISLTCFAAL